MEFRERSCDAQPQHQKDPIRGDRDHASTLGQDMVRRSFRSGVDVGCPWNQSVRVLNGQASVGVPDGDHATVHEQCRGSEGSHRQAESRGEFTITCINQSGFETQCCSVLSTALGTLHRRCSHGRGHDPEQRSSQGHENVQQHFQAFLLPLQCHRLVTQRAEPSESESESTSQRGDFSKR